MKIGIVSLGCAKNLVDTEIVLGFLKEAGFRIVSDPKQAAMIIVNTCGFIREAKEESIAAILEMAEYKKRGTCRGLIVMGCLSQRYGEELWEALPEVDGMLGVNELDQICEVIRKIKKGERVFQCRSHLFDYDRVLPRFSVTGPHVSYLKIAEGCSHRCSYCVIPQIRGGFRSRDPRLVLEEARGLAAKGIKELVVIAQDTTAYGRERGHSLAGLLSELSKLEIPWIRLLYTHPSFVRRELLELMAKTPNLLKYVDLPLQHVAGGVLRRMQRPANGETAQQLIETIRSLIPDAVIRSSFIVGFPGETEREFEELLAFLQSMRLQHVGIFKYSPEEGSAAWSLPHQIPEEIKAERYRQAMELQQQVSYELNRGLVGKVLPVLLESVSQESDLVLLGRHPGQAPAADGLVYLGRNNLQLGSIAQVRITKAYPYDLAGEVVEDEFT